MFLGYALESADRYHEAIVAYRHALTLNPDSLETLTFLGGSLAASGDRTAAMEMIERLKATQSRYEPAFLIANVYASLGDATETFRCLQLAYERKSSPLYLVRLHKSFRRFDSDPRYLSILKQIGLPPRVPSQSVPEI
jgi:tetratricopeptide (TPR) repeat protein